LDKNHKVAVVTGAGRGIGAATAIRLAKDGYDVCVNYVSNKVAADNVVQQARSHNVTPISVKADIASEEDVRYLFKEVDSQLGTLSALVNNAGIIFPQSKLVDMSADRINSVLSTNVTGSFLCCQQAIKRMSIDHGGAGGVIVNVSSAAARIGSPGEYIDYAASKGAIDSLTLGLASEVAAEG